VVVGVQDQGPGLTEQDKAKLFGKFQKLTAKPTDSEGSTGLGLSIVKKYVDAMDGKVWVQSKKDQGATFFVEFKKMNKNQPVLNS
jgi:signal transduction histidine kinase